mgnify:CR=1 FL=1
MRSFLIIILFFSISILSAQKLVKKSVLNDNISLININTENCFKVALETGKSNDILVEAKIEGEYQNDLSLRINEKGTSVFIDAGFNPNFKNPNDKLSAHKVISISLKITIPEHQNVHLYGKSSNVTVGGTYKNLNIVLSDGLCRLNHIKGKTVAKTQSGNIYLNSNEVLVTAESKYGEVNIGKTTKGNNIFDLSSITGNIQVIDTK